MEQFNLGRNEQTDQQAKWERAKYEVEHLVDKLGLGIDEGIKETVAILRAMDVPTISSCAGHRSDEDGYGTPYVQISSPEPKGWEKDASLGELWTAENLQHRERLQRLLDEFYAGRQPVEEARLYIRNLGGYAISHLQSIGVTTTKPSSKEEAIKKISLYQQEMGDFTTFLKDKFFSRS